MADLKDLLQSADWKTEKHVPVIEAQDLAKKGEFFKITVSVGKEIPHPNKTEHYISWIGVYFQPQGEKYPYQIAKTEFTSHGASINGADTSTVYTHPEMSAVFKTDKPGVIYASSYCNIHGLWQSSRELKIG
ncbi:MAG: class II SORL domain-containing protein [Candidatus Omnitrophota bacterium]|nr:class II SORL domain-containing protein [Candidatus Omnitrophota bacterium]